MSKRVKKVVFGTIGVLVLLLAAILVVVIFQLGAVVKSAVETMGPKFTGGTVTLESAHIRPLRGKAMLKGLVVGNPAGFQTPSAMELGELRFDMDPASVTADTILIHEILVDGPQITLEMNGFKDNNLSAIQRNVAAATPKSTTEPQTTPTPTPEPEQGQAPAKKVVIENLIVRNGKIRISSGLMQGGAITVPLPEIHLRDIGKDKETSIPEAISMIISEILNAAIAAVMKAPEIAGKGLKMLGGAALVGGKFTGNLVTNVGGQAIGIVGDVAGGTATVVGDVAGGTVHVVGGVASGTVHAVSGGAAAAGKGLMKLTSGIGGLLGGKDEPATNPAPQP
jgi:hypothetical protein